MLGASAQRVGFESQPVAMSKQERTHHFQEKNRRRREAKATCTAEEYRYGRFLRGLGLEKQITEEIIPEVSIENEHGVIETHPAVTEKIGVRGVPGAFGNGSKKEWNERVVGTLGAEK